MKGYGIYVKNDLLDPKHSRAIGTALWEYLWCLDKITSIDESGVGKILGGKPVKLGEISLELGISDKHISKHLKKLEQAGYIELLRTPYGFVVKVNKATKVFGNKENRQKVSSENGQKRLPSRKKVSSRSKKVSSNKTIQLDNTKTIQVAKATKTLSFGNSDINEIIEYFKTIMELPQLDGTIKSNRYSAKRLLTKTKDNVGAVKLLIDCLSQDEFHSQNASSLNYLDKHAVAIMQRARKNNQKIVRI